MNAVADEVAEFETLASGEGGEDNGSGDGGCLGTRSTLTGDWHGYRTCLQQSGVTFAGRSTHFAFGIDGGVDSPLAAALLPLGQGDTFKYTGRGEYDLIFDLEKFGGLPYGKLLVRAEHWYGELNVTPDVQYILPGNRAIADDAFVYGLRVNMTL